MSSDQAITRDMVSCQVCNELYSQELPCCCSSRLYTVLGVVCRDNGYCTRCCPDHGTHIPPTKSHILVIKGSHYYLFKASASEDAKRLSDEIYGAIVRIDEQKEEA